MRGKSINPEEDGPDGEALYQEWYASLTTKNPTTFNSLAVKYGLTFNQVNGRILAHRQAHQLPAVNMKDIKHGK